VSTPAANAALVTGTNIYANATDGAATAVASVGLLGSDGTVALAQTATLLSTGTIAVGGFAGTALTAQNISVTGGTITLASNTGAAGTGGLGAVTIDGASLAKATAAAATGDASNKLNAAIKPNAGATTMTISIFDGATTTAAVKRIVVTIATTSSYNKFSAADSTVYWGDGAGDTAITDATSSNSKKANGSTLAGEITLVDAYGNLLTSSSAGILTATVSSGAVVNLNDAATAGTSTVDFNAATAAAMSFNVQQATANVGVNVTVTFSWKGVVFATKSGVIGGEVAKVTMLSPKIGTTGGANATSAVVQYEDSLGNAVYPASGTAAVGTTLGAVISAVTMDYGTDNSTDPHYIAWTCSTAGTVKGLQIKHLNASGTVVTSNAVDAGCAGVSTSVTGSWDKASYAPGTIATLSLTFKDSKGNLASAFENIGGDDNANSIMTITGAPSTAAVTPVSLTDKPSGITGTKTYQFVVGTTEGDFIAVVVPTEVKANNPLASNLSLPYSVKSTSTTVTNAEILKSIVALIASINKQIQALQKLILKR
jgi:hypothetical protein